MVNYIRNELWIMRNGPGMRHLALLERAWGKSALPSGAERYPAVLLLPLSAVLLRFLFRSTGISAL